MKKYLGVFLVSIVFLLSSFTRTSGMDEVINALRSGNASLLARNFDVTVELVIPGKSNSFSKNQAETILSDFFATNKVLSFNIMHQGDNGGSKYCIGTLITKSGSFRTTIYLKSSRPSGNLVVQEIRFEK